MLLFFLGYAIKTLKKRKVAQMKPRKDLWKTRSCWWKRSFLHHSKSLVRSTYGSSEKKIFLKALKSEACLHVFCQKEKKLKVWKTLRGVFAKHVVLHLCLKQIEQFSLSSTIEFMDRGKENFSTWTNLMNVQDLATQTNQIYEQVKPLKWSFLGFSCDTL